MTKKGTEIYRTEELSANAAELGFDWESVEGVLSKVEEELQEVREAIIIGKKEPMREEMGDLFFSILNLFRHLDIDSIDALSIANDKFEERWRGVRHLVKADQKELKELTLEELDRYWERVKRGTSDIS